MDTLANAGDNRKLQHVNDASCPDSQIKFVSTLQDLLKNAIDNTELRRIIEQHARQLVSHDQRITFLENAEVSNTENVKKILLKVEGSLSVDDQKQIALILKQYNEKKTKFLKWYIPISAVLIFVSFFGATAKEVLAAISKLIVKALI